MSIDMQEQIDQLRAKTDSRISSLKKEVRNLAELNGKMQIDLENLMRDTDSRMKYNESIIAKLKIELLKKPSITNNITHSNAFDFASEIKRTVDIKFITELYRNK